VHVDRGEVNVPNNRTATNIDIDTRTTNAGDPPVPEESARGDHRCVFGWRLEALRLLQGPVEVRVRGLHARRWATSRR